MSSDYDIKIDFYSDWIDILRNRLLSLGYNVEPDEKPQDISIRYFNLRKRLVSPFPRNVLKSKEFNCPEENIAGLDMLIEKIKNGEDLRPYLSRSISNLDFDDLLLNDWGIYHLHLGTTLDKDEFVSRTRNVIFVRLDEKNAYLIDVMPHRKWACQNLVRIVHRNWPHTIDKYRIKDAVRVNEKLSDEQIYQARKAGVFLLIEVEEGAVYMPIGGGIATSGTSIDVVRVSDYYADRVKALENVIKENIADFVIGVQEAGIKVGGKLKFRFAIRGKEVVAFETTTNVGLILGEL